MVQLLLQAGADVDARTSGTGETALHLAAGAGAAKVAQLLLHAGAVVHAFDFDGHTSLHHAATIDDSALAQMLLDRGASVNCTSIKGETPLHVAAAWGGIETVQLLLRRGVNINSKTDTGGTALTAALSGQHSAVVQLLLNKGARVSADTLRCTAEEFVPEDVLLVVAALGPAADASVLSNACRSAAAASRMDVAVLLKQLCLTP
jgi:ankyrin repeat protein